MYMLHIIYIDVYDIYIYIYYIVSRPYEGSVFHSTQKEHISKRPAANVRSNTNCQLLRL